MTGQAVREWLMLLTMEKYTDNFLERGYDCIAQCKLIISSDLVMLGVDNASHRKLLLDGVQILINSPEYSHSEPYEQNDHFEREEENLFEGSAVPKYLELFKFLNTKPVRRESIKLPFPLGPAESPDQDELAVMPRKYKRIRCRKAIDFKETDDLNCIPQMYKYCWRFREHPKKP